MFEGFNPQSPVVSVDALAKALGNDRLRILFTSMADPGDKGEVRLPDNWIPGTQLFDFERVFCNPDSPQPHTLPSPERFAMLAGELGLNNESEVVVYDAKGLFCAARVWFMFRQMGHKRVWVLEGGLPAWLNANGKTESPEHRQPWSAQTFVAHVQNHMTSDKDQILESLANPKRVVVDARGAARFAGKAQEPRQGVRSGHIPGALNMPYTTLIQQGKLHSPSVLKTMFDERVNGDTHMVFSCGSGVTACILAMAAELAGRHDWSVYDGSWTEWGGDETLPIATC